MKNSNFINIGAYLSIFALMVLLIQIVGLDAAFASSNQLVGKIKNIESNLLLVAQAAAGIAVVIALIVWNAGNPELGKMIAKGGAVGIIITFIYPSFMTFLRSIGG